MLEVVGPYVLYIFSAKISYLRPPLLDDESSPTTQLIEERKDLAINISLQRRICDPCYI